MLGTPFLLMIVGLAALIIGAELLVRGASALAAMAGISPLVVGLTVVAFGTSAPELAISVQAAWTGQAGIAIGNVIGSNIFNVLFILGISALIVPLVVAQQLVRFDVPLLIGVSTLTFILCWDGSVGRLDGILLTAGLLAYVFWTVRQSRHETAAVQAEYAAEFGEPPVRPTRMSIVLRCGLVLAGLVLLILGSRWFGNGAVLIARAWGISELVIGLTIVAVGTSLPEVATSILAAIRGERDIAVGNVVGSNLFNLLAVLGMSSLVSPAGIEVSQAALRFDIPVMLAVTVACLPIFFTGHEIARWEGGLFFAYYIAYTGYLVLQATRHEALPAFSFAMGAFVIPLTALTLVIVTARAWKRK